MKAMISAIKSMQQSEASYRASALAYSTLLSLVPFVSVFVFIMSQFPIFTKLNRYAKQYVIDNFVPTSSSEIITYLDKFSNQAAHLPIFSIIFLFVTSILLVITIDNAMNTIWHKQPRQWNLLSLFIYPLVVLLLPIFIIAIALLSSFLFFIFSYFPAVKIMGTIVPCALNTFILSCLYTITSNKKIRWHDTIFGALIASILLEFSKMGFAFYINQFSNYNIIYGALATIPILLIWLYIFWFIILYGAFIVKAKLKK